MARIRTIKPEFPQSESIGRLSRDARLLFIQLWTIVDDAGRTRASSRMLASLLYPYDDDARDLVDGWLSELEDAGKIRLYVVEGSTYLDIPNWLEHQKIDKPSKSRLPSFDDGSRIVANVREASATDLGPRTSTLDHGPVSPSARSVAKATRPDVSKDFDEFWKAYPKREGPNSRKSALQRYEIARKRGVEHATVMAGLKRYVATLTTAGQIGTRFVQQAETWLSKESWSDHADVEGAPEVIEVHAIKLGTPEWRAWFDFSEANGPKFVHSQMVQVENIGMGQMAFRSRWPPGHENQITAPTEIVTPISEHAA